eukprot:SAG11_NODE_15891_length_563_cov_1.474138_1_plen_71_part_01
MVCGALAPVAAAVAEAWLRSPVLLPPQREHAPRGGIGASHVRVASVHFLGVDGVGCLSMRWRSSSYTRDRG